MVAELTYYPPGQRKEPDSVLNRTTILPWEKEKQKEIGGDSQSHLCFMSLQLISQTYTNMLL